MLLHLGGWQFPEIYSHPGHRKCIGTLCPSKAIDHNVTLMALIGAGPKNPPWKIMRKSVLLESELCWC